MTTNKSNIATYAIAALVLVFVANFLAVRFTGYPFAYCMGAPVAGKVYAEWQQPAIVVLLVASMVCLFMRKYLTAAKAFFFLVLVGALPGFGEAAFRMGSSCHG